MPDFAASNERSTVSDEHLMAETVRGEIAGFEALVRRYQSRALTAAYRFLGDRQQAEDIAQEVFLRVYRNAAVFRPEGSFRTWFYQILQNACRDALRKRRFLIWSPLSADMAVVEEGGRFERADQIRRSLLQLPERQRIAVVLCHGEGLSYQEAAAALGVSAKAVESLLGRARQTLRKSMEE